MTDDQQAGQNALEAALDWTKVSTGLATGALVFGTGLLDSAELVPAVRCWLVASWVLFGLSVLGGLFAQARLPVMMRGQTYNLEDKAYTTPARIQQVTFFIGVVLLLISLVIILFHRSTLETLAAGTAKEAGTRALDALPPGFTLDEVRKVELVKGLPDTALAAAVWHLQLAGSTSPPNPPKPVILDLFVDAATGTVTRVGGPDSLPR